MANSRRPGTREFLSIGPDDPPLDIEINLRYPERSKASVNGVDLGIIQVEWRFGKQSGNEIVLRVPQERCKIRLVRARK